MLKIEKYVLPDSEQWQMVIEGMRNPMNSWDKSDTLYAEDYPFIGEKDHKLMVGLNRGGTEHSKYRRMIPVWVTINAPLYWWKEADTYTVGKVQNSCSTMHKIHSKKFTLDDFSHEHLIGLYTPGPVAACIEFPEESKNVYSPLYILENVIIKALNKNRDNYIKVSEALKTDLTDAERKHKIAQQKYFWWQMIQLLPTSYNQKRTVFLNYEVLAKMYRERKNHKLDEWHTLCDWIKTLPYSELITMEE